MSDELSNATRIAALEEQVLTLTDALRETQIELEAMTEHAEHRRNRAKESEHALANARKWIDGQDVLSDFPNATAMRQALDRERERCFVLEREVLKWRYAEYISRAIENAAYLDTERHELNAARTETDTRHALDAAKFGKEPA